MVIRYKNGSEVSQSNRIFMTTSENGQCTLIVSQTNVGDSGSYECEISNEGGKEKTQADVIVEGRFIKNGTFFINKN